MKRSLRPTLLFATTLLAITGCASEPSSLSPLADANPDKHALASREMDEVARRNKVAEASYFRRVAARPQANPEANQDRPQNAEATADNREKS